MNKIQQWDLQVCRICLLHAYNRPQARISRLISRTGDGSTPYWRPCSGGGGGRARAGDAGAARLRLRVAALPAAEKPAQTPAPGGVAGLHHPSDRSQPALRPHRRRFSDGNRAGRQLPALGPLLFVWAALVGASRLLLGVHYLSDLVAGALLGGGCALLALGWGQ